MLENRPTRGHGLLEDFLAKKRASMADHLIPGYLRTGRILDLGCGCYPGFLRHVEFREKYGIDPSLNFRAGQEGVVFKTWAVETLEPLPFVDGYIDVVTMLAVVEHFPPIRLPFLLKEIWRILSPMGRLIVTTPSPWSASLLRVMARLGLVSPEELDDHKALYGQAALIEYFLRAGFCRGNIRCGYFEVFFNSWICADK